MHPPKQRIANYWKGVEEYKKIAEISSWLWTSQLSWNCTVFGLKLYNSRLAMRFQALSWQLCQILVAQQWGVFLIWRAFAVQWETLAIAWIALPLPVRIPERWIGHRGATKRRSNGAHVLSVFVCFSCHFNGKIYQHVLAMSQGSHIVSHYVCQVLCEELVDSYTNSRVPRCNWCVLCEGPQNKLAQVGDRNRSADGSWLSWHWQTDKSYHFRKRLPVAVRCEVPLAPTLILTSMIWHQSGRELRFGRSLLNLQWLWLEILEMSRVSSLVSLVACSD